jgi:hypothetical protein
MFLIDDPLNAEVSTAAFTFNKTPSEKTIGRPIGGIKASLICCWLGLSFPRQSSLRALERRERMCFWIPVLIETWDAFWPALTSRTALFKASYSLSASDWLRVGLSWDALPAGATAFFWVGGAPAALVDFGFAEAFRGGSFVCCLEAAAWPFDLFNGMCQATQLDWCDERGAWRLEGYYGAKKEVNKREM